MCLSELPQGRRARVGHIPDEELRTQLLRFGITAGTEVQCHCKLPLGPVVLRFGSQEIALGRTLADKVQVEL